MQRSTNNVTNTARNCKTFLVALAIDGAALANLAVALLSCIN